MGRMIESIVYTSIDDETVYFGNIFINRNHPSLFVLSLGDFLFPNKQFTVMSESWQDDQYVLYLSPDVLENVEHQISLIINFLENYSLLDAQSRINKKFLEMKAEIDELNSQVIILENKLTILKNGIGKRKMDTFEQQGRSLQLQGV
jgi:hypothetical protein